MVAVVEHDVCKRNPAHLAHRRGPAGRYDIVIGLVLLKHQPHRLDVVASEAQVPLCIDIAKAQFLLSSQLDAACCVGYFPSHKLDAALRGLVVEHDTAVCVHVVALPVIDGKPVTV